MRTKNIHSKTYTDSLCFCEAPWQNNNMLGTRVAGRIVGKVTKYEDHKKHPLYVNYPENRHKYDLNVELEEELFLVVYYEQERLIEVEPASFVKQGGNLNLLVIKPESVELCSKRDYNCEYSDKVPPTKEQLESLLI